MDGGDDFVLGWQRKRRYTPVTPQSTRKKSNVGKRIKDKALEALEGALSGHDDVNNNNTGGKDGVLLLRLLITTGLARHVRACCGWRGVAGDVAVHVFFL